MDSRRREAQCLRAHVEAIDDIVYHDLWTRYTPDVADLAVKNFTLYGRMLSATHPTLTKTNPALWAIYSKKVRSYWFMLS